MPRYLIANGWPPGGALAKNLTQYNFPTGYIFFSATEASRQILARDSYTLSNLYVYVSANTITNGTTVSSRDSSGAGGAGNQSVSIPASTTGAFTDSVNTDSLVDGDLFCTKIVTPDAGTSITFTIFSYILSTASNTTPILAVVGSAGVSANLVRYFQIAGAMLTTATETSTYYTFRVAATLSNLICYVSVNTVTAASTLITRINGANGSQSVSITASTTGTFEDTTNTDSVSVGENVNYQITTGATGTSLTLVVIQVKSNSAGGQVAVAYPGTTTLAKALTRYVTIGGSSQHYNATEALVQATCRSAFTAKNMYVNIAANTVTAASTFTLRKDGANGGLLVSVPSTATGQFEDLDPAHAVNFVEASLINWGIVTGATGTDITIVCIGFELAQPAAPPVVGSKSAHMAAKLVAAGVI